MNHTTDNDDDWDLDQDRWDHEEYSLLQSIAEHASDLRLAEADVEFGALNGGVETLKKELFDAVKEWEDFLQESGM